MPVDSHEDGIIAALIAANRPVHCFQPNQSSEAGL
jgi:hypothetical protein